MFLGARSSILTTFYYLNASVYNLSAYSTFEDTENGSSELGDTKIIKTIPAQVT